MSKQKRFTHKIKMIESQHLCPGREEVLHHVHNGSVCFWLHWRHLLSHWWEKHRVCFPEGERLAATSSSPTSWTPMSSSLSSQSSSFSHHCSCPHRTQEHCQHLHQHCKKFSPSCGSKKLESGPVGLPRCPWARCSWWHALPMFMYWCDVGVKTVNSPLGINDVCFFFFFFFFFFYQPYHPHHHQHPHYLVNPPHPHQILLLPFIILEPSEIIQRKCWSPGDRSLNHQEQAHTLYEHVDTHTSGTHTRYTPLNHVMSHAEESWISLRSHYSTLIYSMILCFHWLFSHRFVLSELCFLIN